MKWIVTLWAALISVAAFGQNTVRQVPNVARLIQSAGSANSPLVETAGYYAAGDGGGATYRWAAGYTGQTNALGGALAVAGGAWVQASPLSIASFGARTGAGYDNAPSINAAIEWGNQTNANHTVALSPKIAVPEGDWHIQTPIKMRSGVWLIGASESGSRIVLDWSQSGLPISGITQTAGTATATFSAPHGLSTGDYLLLSGAVETNYNAIFRVTATAPDEVEFTVDPATASPATGTLVATRDPWLVTNWVLDEANEFSDVGRPSNFGLKELTLIPNLAVSPPLGAWAVRWRAAVEVKMVNVRLPIHRGAVGAGDANFLNGIRCEYVTDPEFENVTVDQGRTHLGAYVNFGAPWGILRGRIHNFFSFSGLTRVFDLYTAFANQFSDVNIVNSGGDQSSQENIGIYMDPTSFGNRFAAARIHTQWNYGAVVDGDANIFSDLWFRGQAVNLSTNYAKVGIYVTGDNNDFTDVYVLRQKVGIQFADGASGNTVRGFKTVEVEAPVIGYNTRNLVMYDRLESVGTGAVWNFGGNAAFATPAFLSSQLTDSIGSGSAFTIAVDVGAHSSITNTSGQQSLGILAIAGTQTPAAGSGSVRLLVDTFGRIQFIRYGSTSSDRLTLQTRNNAFEFGRRNVIAVRRQTNGDVDMWLNGARLEPLTVVTNGAAPSGTAAITGPWVSLGASGNSLAWNGWIAQGAVFNRSLTDSDLNEFASRNLAASPAKRRGGVQTFNGTFESNLNDWATAGTSTITRVAGGAGGSSWSMEIGATAANSGAAVLTTTIPATSGLVEYDVSFSAKWNSGTTNWFAARGDNNSPEAFNVPDDGNWHSLSVRVGGEFAQPTGMLRIMSLGAAGNIQIDNVTATRIGALFYHVAEDPRGVPIGVGGQVGSWMNAAPEYTGPITLQPRSITLTTSGGAVTIPGGNRATYSHYWAADGSANLAFSGLVDGDTGTLLIYGASTNVNLTLPSHAKAPGGSPLVVSSNIWSVVAWENRVIDSTNVTLVNIGGYE